jgi:hypothetical protein
MASSTTALGGQARIAAVGLVAGNPSAGQPASDRSLDHPAANCGMVASATVSGMPACPARRIVALRSRQVEGRVEHRVDTLGGLVEMDDQLAGSRSFQQCRSTAAAPRRSADLPQIPGLIIDQHGCRRGTRRRTRERQPRIAASSHFTESADPASRPGWYPRRARRSFRQFSAAAAPADPERSNVPPVGTLTRENVPRQ